MKIKEPRCIASRLNETEKDHALIANSVLGKVFRVAG